MGVSRDGGAVATTGSILLRAFDEEAEPSAVLEALVALWNEAFADRRNFTPLTVERFRRRIVECRVFDPSGLVFAWHRSEDGLRLVGFAHAFKPTPRDGPYRIWEPRHHLAMLYVTPELRRRGIGSRLLKLAENWLYYCPVHVADHLMPCYGAIEGLRPPFFGSSERMGISATDSETIRFFARRGYGSTDVGDVSMRLAVGDVPLPTPQRDRS